MFRKKGPPSYFFYLLIFFCFLLFLDFLGIVRPLRGLLEKSVIIPVKEKVYQYSRFFKKDLGSCDLKNEKEVSELKSKIAILSEENLQQKRLLSSPLPKNWQFMTVKVISSAEEILLLNAGKVEGVKEGMIALFDNTYLGKVFFVSEGIAKVKLPSFFEEKSAVKIVSDETVVGKGLLVGRGQGKLRVEQILSGEGVEKKDLVTIEVEGGNLLIGEVEEVMQKKGEVFKTAQVKRLYNPEDLNTIFLLRGKL